jgi:hypothetical protein
VAQNNFDYTQLMPEKPDAGFAFISSQLQIRLRLKLMVRILLKKNIAVQNKFTFEDLVLRIFLLLSRGNQRLPGKWDSIDFVNK